MISVLLVVTLLIAFLYSITILRRARFVGGLGLLASGTSILLVIYPEQTTILANELGVGRGTDLLLYCCFMVGSVLFLSVHQKIRKIEDKLTVLTRNNALQNPRFKDLERLLEGESEAQ